MEATVGSQPGTGARDLFTLPVTMERECHTPKQENQAPRGPFTLLLKQAYRPGTTTQPAGSPQQPSAGSHAARCPWACLDTPAGLYDLGQELTCLAVATSDCGSLGNISVLRNARHHGRQVPEALSRGARSPPGHFSQNIVISCYLYQRSTGEGRGQELQTLGGKRCPPLPQQIITRSGNKKRASLDRVSSFLPSLLGLKPQLSPAEPHPKPKLSLLPHLWWQGWGAAWKDPRGHLPALGLLRKA